MLRTQVAVAFDDMPVAHPRLEERRRPLEKRSLPAAGRLDHRDRQREFRSGQFPEVAGDVRGKAAAVFTRRHRHRRAFGVEAAEQVDHAANVVGACRAGANHTIEHPFRGQPPHLDQPVDNGPVAVDPKPPVGADGQRHDAEVDIPRQA